MKGRKERCRKIKEENGVVTVLTVVCIPGHRLNGSKLILYGRSTVNRGGRRWSAKKNSGFR